MKLLTNDEYKTWKNKEHILIHILPKKHYEHYHLENAINICVYETSFTDKVKKLHLDSKQCIVVYGESDDEYDSKAAAEKLENLGFTSVFVLEAQSSGLDTDQLLSIKDGNYILAEGSKLQWLGANANGSHYGDIALKNGHIQLKNGKMSGEFIIDMHSINTLDLNEEQGVNYLNTHLKSEDFFLSKLFPQAIYRFDNIQSVTTPYQTDTNYILDGELNMKGISRKQKINVLISKIDNILILNARVEIDRTKWGIIYGSTKFFKFLGMHKVFDTISIDMRLELVS